MRVLFRKSDSQKLDIIFNSTPSYGVVFGSIGIAPIFFACLGLR